MIYNELHVTSDRTNDRTTRYPSPISPMDSLIASCPTFDMSSSPSLQDSSALPSYRVQFSQELSLLDENERSSGASFSSSMAESYSNLHAHGPSATFPLSFLDGTVFPEDVYASSFGPMLQPSSELSWTPRTMTSREHGQAGTNNGLCLSPYAVNLGHAAYSMSPHEASSHEYMGRSSFESSSSSETESLPRTPETITPSVVFGGAFGGCLSSQTSSQKRESSSWDPYPVSSSSSFLENDAADAAWQLALGMKGKNSVHESLHPAELRQLANARRAAQTSMTKRKRTSTRSAAVTTPRRSAAATPNADGTFGEIEFTVLSNTLRAASRCEECNKTFQRPEHLTRHKKSEGHTKDKPYICELERCRDRNKNRKSFNRQDNKTAHIIKTHLTAASKGRRDRVHRDEARLLGWEKYFAAADREAAKQDKIALQQSGRTGSSNGNSVNGSRIAKKTAPRTPKATR